jgi:S1-C subfamily serine protease
MRSQPLACILLLTLLVPAAFPADEAKPSKPVPMPALKPAPENVDDLRALEKQVQVVIAKVQPATVGVIIGFAQGSGVIIKDGYVLTAGHVSDKPGRPAVIRLADGRKLKGKTLGHNGGIDSGLIKIEEAGKFPTVEMGKSADLKKGQWVIAIGHPGGFRPNRTPVVRLGRVLSATPTAINTDCALVGGDSGGPLFDLDGKVIGIHSRIGPFNMSQNFHVPVDTYVATWDKLAKGERWGIGGSGQLVQSPGGKVVFEKKDQLTSKDPKDKSFKSSHHKVYTFKMTPGALYTLDAASTEMDSYLRLEDSSGKELARDDDSAGNLDARIVFLPTKEDNYRIVVTTFKPGETGPFALSVRRLELKEMVVQGKVNVLAAVKLPRFAAPELIKQRSGWMGPGLFVNGTILDAAGKPVANKELQFQWDGGKTNVKTNGEGIVRLRLSLKNFKDLVLDLPKDHQALLELTDVSRTRRVFRFSRDDGQKKAPVPAGTIVLQLEGQIAPTDPMDKVRVNCRHKVHAFKVTGGPKATYTIDLESVDFDAFLRVEGAGGKQVAEDDDSAGEYNSRIVLHPTNDDNLRLIVTTCDPGQFGAYRLIVRRAEGK